MPEENNITEEEVNWLRSLVEKFTTKHTSKSVGEIAQNQPTLGSGTDELVASLIESQKVIPTITKSMETIAQSNAKMSEAFGVMSAKLDQVLVKETATENQEQEEEGVGVGGNTIERQEIKNEDKPVNKTINEKYEKLNKTETPKKEEKKKEEDNMKKLTPEEEKQLQNKEQQTRKNINNGSNGLHPPVFTPLTEDKTTQERASKEYMAGRTFESLIRRGGNKVSFIMDDYYYADNVFPKVDTIKRRENFDIDWKSSAQIRKMLPNHTMKSTDSLAKWDWGAPFVNAGDPKLGKIAKPGMAPAAEGSAFLAELVYKSKFFEECDMKTTDNPNNKFTFIKLTNSLKGLRRIENEPYEQIKHLTEREKGKQIDEVYAEPYESYISIPWTVIVENLERGDFLRTVQELDMNNRQYNMGQLGLYAKKDWARGNSDEININDGLLQQLTVCHTEYGERIEDTDRIYPQGFFSGIHGNGTEKVQIDFDATAKGEDPISQMIKMSAQYDIQQVNGASNKKFLVSPEVYSQLQLLQINRETELEDRLIQTSEGMRIGDCPIEQCTDLAQPCGVWGKAKTDSGEVPAQYILLGNFKEGFCNCMREDFQTHWEFHQLREMYIGDTKLYWVGYLKDPTKILAAEVINLPSLKARSKGGTPAGPSGDPQDNQIEM